MVTRVSGGEVTIMPRGELKVGAAHEWLPICETYPKYRNRL